MWLKLEIIQLGKEASIHTVLKYYVTCTDEYQYTNNIY